MKIDTLLFQAIVKYSADAVTDAFVALGSWQNAADALLVAASIASKEAGMTGEQFKDAADAAYGESK